MIRYGLCTRNCLEKEKTGVVGCEYRRILNSAFTRQDCKSVDAVFEMGRSTLRLDVNDRAVIYDLESVFWRDDSDLRQ